MISFEILSQSHSGEYDWLGPDLPVNTGGQYIHILLLAVVMLTYTGHNHYRVIYQWIQITKRLLKYVFFRRLPPNAFRL